MDAVRNMLDELMGKERDVPLEKRASKTIRYDDPLVCQYQVCGLCPHRLFKNTRSDLGPCPYEYHDDHINWASIQAEFDKQSDREKERFERRLMKVLEDLIREMDRKINKNKDRAAAESAPKPLKAEDQIRLSEMLGRVKELQQRSQEAGEAGNVDESMALAQQAEEAQQAHDRLHRTLITPDRTMTVCEICGVFINSTDNEQRRLYDANPNPTTFGALPQPVQDHLTGKQYLGWKAIREKHKEMLEKMEKQSTTGRGSREPEEPRSNDRERVREKERERSPRSRERERDYRSSERDPREGREREYRSSDRERDRDYDRGRDRDGRDYRDSRDHRDSRDYRGGGGSGRDHYDDRRRDERRRY